MTTNNDNDDGMPIDSHGRKEKGYREGRNMDTIMI